MRRRSKIRMSLRGRTGVLAYIIFGTTAIVAIYYAWNHLIFSPPSKITYSSVNSGHGDIWDKQKVQGFVIEEPPIGLNKEIEIQMQSEKWKKAKALQDRIDEERLIEEEAAQQRIQHENSAVRGRPDRVDDTRLPAKQDTKQSKPLLYQQTDPVDGDYYSRLERLVHLDLKGAPPLVSYLETLFPVLKRLGATGLLLEYEDMFPYTGNLSILTADNAYSQSDLQRIHAAAQANGLEIIPLVQTFGHMEFVLKHKQYIGLREHEYTPQVITPAKEQSYKLLFEILEQILRAHPKSQRVHLGCDEVYNLGEGESNTFMTSHRLSPKQLFLSHVVKLARHLKNTYPKFRTLIWDDWLRSIPYDQLADSGLPGLVEPVVWYYRANILQKIPSDVWDKYGKLFPAVWIASAFKGATGSAQILTNASMHLENNLQWVNIVRTFGIQTKKVTFRGTVLTGWQRYDHFATLCELLPVGLPSLALSLQAIRKGGFGPKELNIASHLLNCSNILDMEYPSLDKNGALVSQDCSFPASTIYYSIQQLWGILEVYKKDRSLQERISGWMTDYHIKHGISNPGQMKVLIQKLNKVVDRLHALITPIRKNLLQVYDVSTVDEWITTNVQDRVKHIKELMEKAKKFFERKDWPARPFPEAPLGASEIGNQSGLPDVEGAQVNTGNQIGIQRMNSQQKDHVNANNNEFSQRAVASKVLLPNGPQSLNERFQHVDISPKVQKQLSHRLGELGQERAGNAAKSLHGQGGGVLSKALLPKQGRPSGPEKAQQYGLALADAVNADSQTRLQKDKLRRNTQGNPVQKNPYGLVHIVQGLPPNLESQRGLNTGKLTPKGQGQKHENTLSFQRAQQTKDQKIMPQNALNLGVLNSQLGQQGRQNVAAQAQAGHSQDSQGLQKKVVGPKKFGEADEEHKLRAKDYYKRKGSETRPDNLGLDVNKVMQMASEQGQQGGKDEYGRAFKRSNENLEVMNRPSDFDTKKKKGFYDANGQGGEGAEYLDSFIGRRGNNADGYALKPKQIGEGVN